MSAFLSHLHHAYAQTDGTYAFPNSREGDMLRQAKKEVESLKENRDDLLILTKSWAIVWGDKISPKSLELFSQLEAKALGNAAT